MKKIQKIKDKIIFANTVRIIIASFIIIVSMFLFFIHIEVKSEIKELDQIVYGILEKMENDNLNEIKKDYVKYNYADKEYMSVAVRENNKIIYLTENFDEEEMNNFKTDKLQIRSRKLIYNKIYKGKKGREYYFTRNFAFGEFSKFFYIMTVIFILLVISEYVISSLVAKNILTPVSEVIRQSKELNNRNIKMKLEKTRDDEIGELIDVINDTFSKKEELIKSQKKFASDVSHELKTPLAVMKGYLDILKWAENDRELFTESLENIDMEIKNIEKIINNIFLSSNLEKVKLKKEEINVKKFLEKIKRDYEVLDKEQNIIVKADEDIIITGDGYLLSEAVRGLIDNGIKYSGKKKIELIAENRNKKKKIIVRDYGAGIFESETEKIFERYYKKEEKTSGVGLGLSIIRKIILLNDGKIYAVNRKDGLDMIIEKEENEKYENNFK
ncbi:sensor histidine kinase [Leptotrichia sp. OH3620_COT-345]|uniref:sensor histidine kinase n=1 Tax=Leptotrichia sp. OH3620_COT-345 TaxID=2491048 RepID=UPI000F652CDA|nr:HAMP domain-containing sensor histidine kinase [Leptotrichia sp. OH3620_COT-345]RRD40499.1 sensor histidine kinase [Leptotrichia sp. OH3620_COT-345]